MGRLFSESFPSPFRVLFGSSGGDEHAAPGRGEAEEGVQVPGVRRQRRAEEEGRHPALHAHTHTHTHARVMVMMTCNATTPAAAQRSRRAASGPGASQRFW